jgi:hypothetical protein
MHVEEVAAEDVNAATNTSPRLENMTEYVGTAHATLAVEGGAAGEHSMVVDN